jgi:hypothetical protein
VRERYRQTERQRERYRQTDRQTKRQRERERKVSKHLLAVFTGSFKVEKVFYAEFKRASLLLTT